MRSRVWKWESVSTFESNGTSNSAGCNVTDVSNGFWSTIADSADAFNAACST